MWRALGLLLFLTGCSTAPIADFMDHFFPAKIDPNPAAGSRTRGGVCDPPPTVMPTPAAPPGGMPPALPPDPGAASAPMMGPPPGPALPSPEPPPPSPLIRF